MKRLLRSNSKMFITICILTSLVLGLSYAAFKVNTNSYKATNMMVSKLMYALNITEVNKSSSTINNNVITIPANTKSYFLVTISSINKIDSKYSLAYKSSNSVVVKYSDKSEYTPTEEIEGYTTTNTYSKVVKISIDNSSNSTSTEVTINAFGGYTHNSYTSIILDSGYLSISNTYEEGQDINLISYTFDGNTTDKSYEELVNNYQVDTITCENGTNATWNSVKNSIEWTDIHVPETCNINFKNELKTFTLVGNILKDNIISERTDFSVINVENTTGIIYKTNKTENGSEVYYYSGNTTNNWVYFGGFYWRIIRTNEDGSVRLLYAGTSHDTTKGYIGTSAFNAIDNSSTYVGYMYSKGILSDTQKDSRKNVTSSTIKEVLDTWYNNNLQVNYEKYISRSAVYCNDRSVGSGTWGSSSFYFGAYTRLKTNKTPTYKCGGNTGEGLFENAQATEDKFSTNTESGGNGQLTYPIALMTADEIAFAGGVVGEDLSSPYTYYYTNSAGKSITDSTSWWLLSPCYVNAVGSYIFYIQNYKKSSVNDMDYIKCSEELSVRPVLSIDACAKVTGTGTATDPYVIDEANSTC